MRTNPVLDDTDTADETYFDEQDAKDDVFHTLSNRRRRYVLTYLRENGGHSTVREISEELAAWENRIPRAEVSYKQRKRTYTSLIQIHLQTLHDGGFIEYEADRGEMELTDDGVTLARILEEDLVVGNTDQDDRETGWLRGLYRRLRSPQD